MKKSFLVCFLLMLLFLSACAPAVTNSELPSPNVFLRGMEFSSGVRYAATFIKPTAETEMRDVLVEISLPANTILTGIGVPRQAGAAEVQTGGAAKVLVWQIPFVSASQQMDVLSFNVPEKISGSISFVMRWRDAAGVEHLEQFDDFPPVTSASETEAELVVTENGYQAIGRSGVMVSAPVIEPPLSLSVRILPATFNPSAEFGAFWWCSLAEMSGIPAGESVDVVVPLRRPIAPFTKLALFQQNENGSWSLLPETGTVTADGLSVAYAHPGGLIATGGEEDLQPVQVNLQEVVDGTSNTIAFAEGASQPDNVVQNGIADGASNTIIVSEATPVPPTVNDGTSNTIIIGEITSTPTRSVDGASNTIIIGEITSTPTGSVDGASNTIIIGEITSTPTGSVDGASNTIIIGERTPTPTSIFPTLTSAETEQVTPTPISTFEVTAVLPPISDVTPTASPTFDATEAVTPTDIPPTITIVPTADAATRKPENEATSVPRPTQIIRIVTATPLPESEVTPLPTRTLVPTLSLPVVAFNEPADMEARHADENNIVRVVIVNRDGRVVQCQSGGLICAPLNRAPMP